MLHIAHMDIDPADVGERAAGGLDRGFDVLADLASLRLDIADAGDAAVGAARHHAGDEHQPAARLDDDPLREMAARLGESGRDDRLTWHRAPRAGLIPADGNHPASVISDG